VGIGNLYWGSGYKASLPINPSVSVEYGITDQISVGGAANLSTVKFNYTGGSTRYTGVYFGAKGSYHFLTSDKLDPYAGISLGYVAVSAKDNTPAINAVKASGLGWGAHVGARYYFQPNIGAYAELGATSFAVLNLGVAFKF
jgi:outer membrane protein W